MVDALGAGVMKAEDIVVSVADALQYISYFHAPDYIAHLTEAHAREASAPAKAAMAQILASARMAALGRRPICQDTGGVVVFAKVGMGARLPADRPLQALVDEGVRRATGLEANPLRASMVADPLFARTNTGDNTPAVLHVELVPGDAMTLKIAAKGGGSENKARFAVLNPDEDVADWAVRTVEELGAGWCPPGVIALGVGGNAEKAMLLAKEALFEPIDMSALRRRGPRTPLEAMRVALYDRINALGVGAQGLGGLTTVVDVKIAAAPTHAASQPVALIPQCAANRHVAVTLRAGEGPARPPNPDLSLWPEIEGDGLVAGARRLDLTALSKERLATLEAGETVLLSGELLTARDAAHRRIADLLARGAPPPVDLRGRVLYYVGPVPAAPGEVVGPAGPTTAARMDRFTDVMLAEAGVLAAIGKAERSAETAALFARHGAVYFSAVGGAAVLISQAIRSARVVAFEDLGMEAIHAFEVEAMPVTVAVDARGRSIHREGPHSWRRSGYWRRSG